MYILNIETSTKNCSVTIAFEGKVLSTREIADTGYSHAEKLHVFIEELITQEGLQFKDLHAVAVSKGPGSYTGLRIGVSAAKGICYALQIPLLAVDTMRVLAQQINVESGYIVPMLDARRMEVYDAVFSAEFEQIQAVSAKVLHETSYAEFKDKPVYFLGDALEKAQTILKQENFVFCEMNRYPSSKQMAQISYQMYQKSDFVDVAYFEPYYLKEFYFGK